MRYLNITFLMMIGFLMGCGMPSSGDNISYISISPSGDAACDALLSDMAWCIAKDVGDPNAQQNYFDQVKQALNNGSVLNLTAAINYFNLPPGSDMYDSFQHVLNTHGVVYHPSTLVVNSVCEGL